MSSSFSETSGDSVYQKWVKLEHEDCTLEASLLAQDSSQNASFADNQSHEPKRGQYPRISRPFELMRDSYDIVVVGSGYGGAVAASRLARARQSVCVLERGKERWPGEYPTTEADFIRNLRISHYSEPGSQGFWPDRGDSSSLFQITMGEGQSVISASGLGGTSLLNGNVFLEADDVLEMEAWPAELGKEALRPYYERAASMLQPEPYPDHFPELSKLKEFEKQAKCLGLEDKFSRVRQSTRFVDGFNSSGVGMQASSLTGMDTTGVNDGSKSSTLVNYLSDAWNWGAEMFTECEVSHVEKHPTQHGYLVFFKWRGSNAEAFNLSSTQSLMWVHANKCVFLGAGSLGTSEMLLRSKQNGLRMSDKVGLGISGNGDMLSFGYDTDEKINSVACESPSPENPIGPTITGMIDCRDAHHPEEGFVIQEGTIPAALSTTLQPALESWKDAKSPKQNFGHTMKRILERCGSFIFGPRFQSGSMEKTQVYLVMSHSTTTSVLTLQNDRPILKWHNEPNANEKMKIKSLLREATAAIGGMFVEKPLNLLLGQSDVTVHCLGGACISKDGRGENGVTNHLGQLFTGSSEEIHENLIVCDSALIPGALGVNPLATITALAEKFVENYAEREGIVIDYETTNGILDLYGNPKYPISREKDEDLEVIKMAIGDAALVNAGGFRFTEVMVGDVILDGDMGSLRNSRNAQLFLTVSIFDIGNLMKHPSHSVILTGSFTCDGFENPLIIQRGKLSFFAQNPGRPDSKKLEYRCKMLAKNGEEFELHGQKFIDNSSCLSFMALWNSTTTLHITIRRNDRVVVGHGILRIGRHEFQNQLKTMHATGNDWLKRAISYTRFLLYFGQNLTQPFFGPFNRLQWPVSDYCGFIDITTPTKVYQITAIDGIQTALHMWEPLSLNENRPILDILCISGASLDHQVFACPTIETNAVTYFRKAGYRVYCLTHRVGRTVTAQKGHTTFDARLDVHAALKHIRQLQNSTDSGIANRKIYVVAYCAGSIATASGLLDGTIPSSWIAGLTASNVFMNPKYATVNTLKSLSPISLTSLWNSVIGSWYNCTIHPKESYGLQSLLNTFLRFYPVASKSDICNSVTCHRSSFAFGGVFSHKNINEATHRQFHRFIGGVSMSTLEHLVQMGTRGYVTSNAPEYENLVTPSNIQRLKGIPIFFFSGGDNAIFDPRNTQRSYEMLCEVFGEKDYEYEVFEGKGHLDCWIGRDVVGDVYGRVGGHVGRVMVALYPEHD